MSPNANAPLDDDRLAQLVRDEAPRLYRILMFLLHDEELAATILRESFLEIMQHALPDREAIIPARLYAAAIGRSRGLSPRRANPDSDHTHTLLRAALADLGPEQRLRLALCDVGGMTTEQASVILNEGRETFRRRLHGARTVLCKRLHPPAHHDSTGDAAAA